ncbi:hypothetical protein INR49_030223 [Caranx melampygus]|nr:hypothetical protein INR49_030223 [Caranx melampygus]
MAFALPVWLAVQEELIRHDASDVAPRSCFDDFDDESLFQMFHLTRPCIDFITDAVRVRMKTVVKDKPELSADAMVMVALNYYAHGVASTSVLQRVSLSETDYAVVVISTMEEICGIPRVLGILAPAHFRIRASPYEKSTFRSFVNTLGYTSAVSQIICDSDGNILSIEHCCVGSTKVQEMWETSCRGREMENDLHGPYWVIGGKGYSLSNHVLTPVFTPANDKEIRFNEAHTKIHNVMRTTLGSMKRRFRCLMQLGFAQETALNKKSNIIKACSVLHNISKKFSVPPPPVAGKIEPLHQESIMQCG